MLTRPPRLWVLLLASNLAVLALPLSGLWALRLYESALVRQTESELVAQAAVLAAMFREELRRAEPGAAPAPAEGRQPPGAAALSVARRAGLDLADDPVLPPPPEPEAAGPPEARAASVGRALAPVLRDAQAVTLAALRLTDAKGVVVASTGGDLGLSLAGWEEVARVLAGAPVAAVMRRREQAAAVPGGISRTAGLRVFVALPVPGAGGVAGAAVLSRTPRDLGQAAWGKRWELAGLAAALLAAGAGLAAGLSRLVTRPLRVVVAQAEAAARGAPVLPLAHPGTREVAALSGALTRMATTLDQRARYIGAFAASVSHEFKTPLASLRGAAELLEEPGLDPAERARLVAVVADGTARLERLVRRLLELARADMTRVGEGPPTPVGAVAARLVDPGTAVDAGDVTVALPEEALEAVLGCLLDNAAAHGGGAVAIRAGMAGGRSWIEVSDRGPGVSAANRARIFDPFFTTAREAGGTGMGLPIARAIAAAAGGTVALADGPGATFRLELPSS